MVEKKKKAKISGQGKLWVSRRYPDKSEDSEEYKLGVREFEVEPAYVKAGYALTLNLGNYESAKCEAGVTLPCYVEEIKEAFDEAWRIAEEEIQEQVAKVRKGK